LNADERQIAPQLKWMPNWFEFAVVMIVSLGMFVAGSLDAALEHAPKGSIDNSHLLSLLYTEPFLILLLYPLLRARGWTLSRLGFQFGRADVLVGFGLAALAYFGNILLWIVTSLIFPDAAKDAAGTELITSKLSVSLVAAVCFVNPIFEELFVGGYLIRFLKDHRSVVVAVNASVLIRMTYHLYQGPIGVVGIVPFGLVFGWYFARKGRLWPLIIAHAIMDVVGFWSYLDI
jgi:membrane protease YdiL (CAAX protease family)